MKRKKILTIILAVLLIFPSIIHAQDVKSKYSGTFAIDYLIRNYNVITFGQTDNNQLDLIEKNNIKITKGSVNLPIDGPVLINGDYKNDAIPSSSEIKYSTTSTATATSHISGTRGENVKTTSKTAVNKDFIDYSKLHQKVLAESHYLASITEYHINSMHMNIDKPGIYQINSTLVDSTVVTSQIQNFAKANNKFLNGWNYNRAVKYLYIDNYDPNSYYIFNNMKMYEYDNYVVFVKTSEDETFEMLEDFATTKEYTGNIIFNFPNAKLIIADAYSGKLIAPNADVVLSNTKLSNQVSGHSHLNRNITYHDSIFANSILGYFNLNMNEQTKISYKPYTSTKKIELKRPILEEVKDYDDDIYNGTYSIVEMLKNYNVITLGQKEYDSNTYFSNNNSNIEGRYGDASIFHIVGQFLINGDLKSFRMDLESNGVHESTVMGKIKQDSYSRYQTDGFAYKRWGDSNPNIGTNSNVFMYDDNAEIYGRNIYDTTQFINFERLYDTIVEEQKNIQQGEKVEVSNRGVANIKIGTNNYIEDIGSVSEIIFGDFSKNDSELTIITILNEGSVRFPKVSQTSSGNTVQTKDYYGKEKPLFGYEYSSFPADIYHGNIIWNLPNATYISMPSFPLIGHIVAPNADVETQQTHFAGGFIVNSLYASGSSEAHFFPLQAVKPPENYDPSEDVVFDDLMPEEPVDPEEPDNKVEAGTEEIPKNPPTSTGGILILVLLFIIGNITIIKFRNKKSI